ncbi:baseplate multidomain protein megatron [Pseudoroseicyclus aestuarii]|uniref:Putative tail protein n=1 Tax=Pseudoroseicyclus aestuarii TaxID=1795041 RepID=A0A318SWM5_9RHOB|nr:glycoside hydrolase TIM-barrel-like domain-containing protein [Pseudoroseicyclus aestuarii]PYE85725.1 putative tail protein [Pseudoroseicyclus aestuarii]
MATIVLSAAGLALGGSVGGTALGLSGATLGRFAGAALGAAIDSRLLGQGSDAVETGRIDRFRLTRAGEGGAIPRLYGTMRLGGQVIWASRFLEDRETTGGGKGAPRQPKVTEFSYTVSLAVALCEGPITRLGRIWADGQEIPRESLTLRVYEGTEDQLPDPKMEAIEGIGRVPAYRSTAYVVIEDLPLGQFGNRVPQFSFEVLRPVPEEVGDGSVAHLVQGVALIPGTGEYALATEPVHLERSFGEMVPANVNTPSGLPDFVTAAETLTEELPNCGTVSLVVSWFGTDLRMADCRIRPLVEQAEEDGQEMPWTVSGVTRAEAGIVPLDEGRPVYGGTPADASVIQAIQELKSRGQKVVFYPFILMDQMAGNGLPDPYGGGEQPALPWRGRITLSRAPGQAGSPDGTAAAGAQVAAFFGGAQPGDFDGLDYTGPEDWGLRRFILHCAALCRAAGGVDAFCIGSELRGITTARGASGFPAVQALRVLAADVRAMLPGTKISYAADWSEYHGYQPAEGGKLFHLDPLWADGNIDFIGIDNYMPLSDWREGTDHLDAQTFDAIYDLDYLTGNVAGGEGYDWYYASPEARDAQLRTPIEDYLGEPWVWRYKDLASWWANPHYDRPLGERAETPTPWVPRSKPIWFTELGCPSVDKGTNQPNVFVDPKSSESALPYYSDGTRDELIQLQYLRAVHRHFGDPANNPASDVYDGRMLDTARMLVWAWDARPYPWFPARDEVWADGENWRLGHWITGRTASWTLASVVEAICRRAGAVPIDTSALWGLVRGYLLDEVGSARAALQPLMLAHGFDAVERGGVLSFRLRGDAPAASIETGETVHLSEQPPIEITRAAEAEVSGRVRLSYIEAGGDYEQRTAEAMTPDDAALTVAGTELPLALTRAEAKQIALRWLAEAETARETARFALPPSRLALGAGDTVTLEGPGGSWRIDRVEQAEALQIEAVRTQPALYREAPVTDEPPRMGAFTPPVPVVGTFLDLPLLTGDEVPHTPHFTAAARPWPGSVALYDAPTDSDYDVDMVQPVTAILGTTLSAMQAARPGVWDRGPALQVKLVSGALRSATEAALLAGANVMAIGDGASDLWEVFQFAEAELVAPNVYDLRLRLRGQAGTDGVMPQDWPAGSRVVLLDRAVRQVTYPPSMRGVARHYRYGPAQRALDDATFRHEVRAFEGVGLRPYSPCHLRAAPDGAGGLRIGWTRRTRIGGDSWTGPDVPLGEASERYLLEVLVDGALARSEVLTAPAWHLDAATRAALGAGPVVIRVAQLSEVFGPGPFEVLSL